MISRVSIALLATALLAAPAHAETDEQLSVVVRTADLDLRSAGGLARLDRRVRQAAGRICGAPPRSLDLMAAYQDCRSEVLSDAEVKIARMTDRSATIKIARRSR